MLFELHHFVTVPLACGSAFAAWWLLYRWLRDSGELNGVAETAGGAAVATFLLLNLEVWLLSLMPVARPLDWVPLVHLTLLTAGYVVLRKRRTASFWFDLKYSWHRLPLTWRSVLVVGGFLWLLYVVIGACIGLGGVDELSYHGPQAVMLLQEGRLGAFDHPLPWVSAYPRGAANIWGWTMFWTRSDVLFHPVQAMFALQLVAHVAGLAGLLGANRSARIAVGVGLLAMPLVAKLSLLSTSDLCFAAATVGVVAFLVGSALLRQPLGSWRDFLGLLAFAQAAACKVPVVAAWAFAVLVSLRTVQAWRLRSSEAKAARMLRVAVGLGLILVACHSYLLNWWRHNNPLYPITIEVAGRTIFVGPHPPAGNVGVSSTMGAVNSMTLPRKYHAAWADWYAPLTEDSLGSAGPVLLLGWVPLAAAFFLGAAMHPARVIVALGMVILGWLMIPGFFAPRYSLALYGVAAALAAVVAGRSGASSRAQVRLLLLLGISGLTFVTGPLSDTLKWVRANNGAWFSPLRTSRIAEGHPVGFPDIYPGPAMIRAIRDNCDATARLAWNVSAFQALLWNRDYSNRVIFVPGHPDERYPSGPHARVRPSEAQAETWRARVDEVGATHVLVYSGTAYSEMLDRPGSGFGRMHVQDADESRLGMILFHREVPAL